jgi:3-isopropylmalate dehydratase small subunit
MTIANLASEMGAKNAVFPPDLCLHKYFNEELDVVWADPGARYVFELEIDLGKLGPMVASPHMVDNVQNINNVEDTPVQQGLIGTCTNGRIEDLRIAAKILNGKKIAEDFQLHIIPASKEIYLQSMKEGLVEIFLNAGANMLSPSCGPCLGTGQGIPADGINVISTANRNFLGRMGNPKASVYLASPATVAISAIKGKITSPAKINGLALPKPQTIVDQTIRIAENDNRHIQGVWAYQDINNLNTDQMFAGNLTYEVNSSDPEKIVPHLFKGFDSKFAEKVTKGDIIICGDNFGCGSSREHPAVGLVYAGVSLVIVKSVARIFYRSAINQGLQIIVLPEAVEAYKPGDNINFDMDKGSVQIGIQEFKFSPLPDKLLFILKSGGLANAIQLQNKGQNNNALIQ